MAVTCRKSAADLTFSYIQKAKQLRLLLANMGLGFLVWAVFQICLVSHVRFASGFSFQLTVFQVPSGI